MTPWRGARASVRILILANRVPFRHLLPQPRAGGCCPRGHRRGPGQVVSSGADRQTEGSRGWRCAHGRLALPWLTPFSYQGRPIKTEITPSGVWWNAEDYHQHYCEYQCSAMKWGRVRLLTDPKWTSTRTATSAPRTASIGDKLYDCAPLY